MMSREEKSKVKGDKGRVESRGRKVQEKQITREVYGKNFVWVG